MSILRLRPWIAVGSVLLLVLILLTAAIGVLLHTQHRYERALADIKPRYARLAGLAGSEPEINKTLTAQQAELGKLVYDAAAGVDRIGADVQQKIRGALSAANVNVTGSQVFANKPDDKATMGTVTVSVNALASLSALQAGLRSLDAIRPRIYLADMQLVPTRQPDAQQVQIEMHFNAVYLVSHP
ncbi:MAG: type II secretion system protein GspM [Candidatus Cloacimonetes bacterium]|jgi:hypothetical protein|nr:type II secretion system protein GspM [Candidatus Cloacimonadota bacterium]